MAQTEHNDNLAFFLQREYVNLSSKAVIALIPIFIYSIVQLFRSGNKEDYFLLFFGCILSVIAMLGYFIASLIFGIKKQKSFLAMFLTFGGIIPWLFGSYLVFIRGFWSLKNLMNGFSFVIIIKAAIFIFLGYILVKKFMQITELDRKLKEGAFDIHGNI